MKEQESENYVKRNQSKTIGYPEKDRIQERKVFQGYAQQRKIPKKDKYVVK